MRLICLVLILGLSAVLRAEIVNHPGVSQGADLDAWITKVAASPSGQRADCSTLKEVQSVSLCIYSSDAMFKALARANLWAEGSGKEYPQKVLYAHDSPAVAKVARNIAGMDLKGRDLVAFYQAAQAACPTNKNMCLSAEEKELFTSLILPGVAKNPNFVLITGTTTMGVRPAKMIVDHEIYHARYFASPQYRAIVEKHWNALSDEQRQIWIRFLSNSYDTNDLDLVRNEFQAYSLDIARPLTGSPAGPWAQKLREDLYAAGLIPGRTDPYLQPSGVVR